MRSSLGVSLGAANLIAVADGRPTVRRATVTLAPPSLTGFVDRVGDPVPLVAADGSRHYADRLAAGAIETVTRLARPHRRPDVAAVAAPAHWPESAVAALRARVPHLTVVPDAVAALTAVRADRGLPGRGVVVLCDFGATGSSITLVDAGDGMTVIGHTVRSDDFSGDLVDQLVLRHVVTGLDLAPSGTSAVASLADLRVLCRGAKERLSADTATALTSAHTAVRLTRAEFDDVIAHPMDLFVAALIDTLQRNGVPQAQLAAVATVGGGAAIPLVAQRLSETLRIPVVAPADPQAAAAAGAELLALRVAEVEARTTMVPAPTVAAAAVPLAWSAAAEDPALVEFASYDTDYARPEVHFDRADDAFTDPAPWPWYRRPGVVFAGAATLAATALTAFVMTSQAVEAGTTPTGSPGIATPVAVAPLDAAVEAPATPAPVAPAVPFPATETVVAAPVPGPAAAAPGPVQQRTVTKQAAPRPAPAPAAAPVAAPAPAPPAAAPAPAPAPAQPQIPWPVFTFAPPTPEPSQEPAPSPTQQPQTSPSPSQQPQPSPEPSPTPSPSVSPTPSPTPEPSPTPTPTPSQEPQPQPDPAPQASSSPQEPSEEPAPVTECMPAPDTVC